MAILFGIFPCDMGVFVMCQMEIAKPQKGLKQQKRDDMSNNAI
jgi:hypothetical protein